VVHAVVESFNGVLDAVRVLHDVSFAVHMQGVFDTISTTLDVKKGDLVKIATLGGREPAFGVSELALSGESTAGLRGITEREKRAGRLTLAMNLAFSGAGGRDSLSRSTNTGNLSIVVLALSVSLVIDWGKSAVTVGTGEFVIVTSFPQDTSDTVGLETLLLKVAKVFHFVPRESNAFVVRLARRLAVFDMGDLGGHAKFITHNLPVKELALLVLRRLGGREGEESGEEFHS